MELYIGATRRTNYSLVEVAYLVVAAMADKHDRLPANDMIVHEIPAKEKNAMNGFS